MEEIPRIEMKDLRKGDVVIVSRRETGGYGDHYYCLAVVRCTRGKEGIVADMLSTNYETKCMETFLKYVRLEDQIYDKVRTISPPNVSDGFYVSDFMRAPAGLVGKLYDEKVKMLDDTIKKTHERKKKFVSEYEKKFGIR